MCQTDGWTDGRTDGQTDFTTANAMLDYIARPKTRVFSIIDYIFRVNIKK